MDRTERVELTVLCMIYRDGQLLLQNRTRKEWSGYTFPGGHVEPGESFVDAVIREIREETGLTISRPLLCGVKQFPIDKGRYLVLLFKTDIFEGELLPAEQAEEGCVEWIDRDRLEELELAEGFLEMLPVFEREDINEFQYVVENGEWTVCLK